MVCFSTSGYSATEPLSPVVEHARRMNARESIPFAGVADDHVCMQFRTNRSPTNCLFGREEGLVMMTSGWNSLVRMRRILQPTGYEC